MDYQKLQKIFKSKLFIFFLQIGILALFISGFNYTFSITFDNTTTDIHRTIIQFLGNLVLYDNLSEIIFMYILWFVIGLIPVIIRRDLKSTYSINLTIFLILNFFFYVFLRRYTLVYFNTYFPILLLKSIILGLFLVGTSVLICLILNKILSRSKNIEGRTPKLLQIAEENRYKCPYCGTSFESIPLICYNCSKVIRTVDLTEKEKS
ncbi:MAG: hypothetical protein P8Y70_09170 [Candidatus Lokiarchaeota archaeon]